MYAKLINNELQFIPQTYTSDNGDVTFNYHLADESVWISHGFKPLSTAENNPPDNVNNYQPVYAENETEIYIDHWELQPPTVNANALASLLFVKAAHSGEIDEANLLEHAQLFPIWSENWTGKQGDIVQEAGLLYKSIHDIGAGQNTKPSTTPAMWTRIGNPADEFPEWFQPIGAHDAYDVGAKVSHNGKHWINIVTSNIWEPGVYGWNEITDTGAV